MTGVRARGELRYWYCYLPQLYGREGVALGTRKGRQAATMAQRER